MSAIQEQSFPNEIMQIVELEYEPAGVSSLEGCNTEINYQPVIFFFVPWIPFP